MARRGDSLSQPQQIARIDWTNPLTRGLVYVLDGSRPSADVVKGLAATRINSPVTVATTKGRGPALNGTNQSVDTGQKFTSANGTILVSTIATDSTSGSKGLACQSSDNAGNSIGLGWQGGNFWVGGTSNSIGTNSGDLVLAGSWGSGGIVSYVNGSQVNTNPSTAPPSAPAGNYYFELGAFSYSGGRIFQYNHTPVFFAVWDRALSSAEIKAISRNPWQIFATNPRRQRDVAAAGGDTQALTGVAATGSPGTLAPSITQALTGNAATGSPGTLAASTTHALTGTQAAGAVGTAAANLTVALSGAQATGQAGTLAAAPSYALTGASAAAAVGTVAPEVSQSLTGASATGAVGTLGTDGNVTAALSGVAATGAVGTLGPQITQALAGVAATGATGTVGNAVTHALTGNAASGAVGDLIFVGDITLALTGVQATGTAGYLQAVGGDADAGGRRNAAGPAYHAQVGDRVVRGTRQQIEALLRQLAQEHAEEDEDRIEQEEAPKKRAVRVVAPGKVKVQAAAAPSVTVAAPVALATGISQAQAADVYEQAYAAHMRRRQAIQEDDDDVQGVAEHVRRHRAAVASALAKQIALLKDLL